MINPFTLVEYGVKFDPLVRTLEEEGFDLWNPDKALELDAEGIKRTFFVWQGYMVYLRENTDNGKTILRYMDPSDTNFIFVEEAFKYFNLD